MERMLNRVKSCISEASAKLDQEELIEYLNQVKVKIHQVSPFASEPVDCVVWVKVDDVHANDYNPNKVAPPEMELLRHSINHDGYTQPVVTWDKEGAREVIYGFHRTRVCKELEDVKKRVHGYLPVVTVNKSCTDKNDRVASTIRHNRARGKHQVDSMSEIVIELKNRNWTNSRIGRELGMDEDEILRLCQITGLAELFSDQEFSRSWNIDDSEAEFVPLTDEIDLQEKEEKNFRTVNTNDEKRIFHTFEKWECHKAGFYNPSKDGVKKDAGERMYAEFLSNNEEFRSALSGVLSHWINSCEHYLTNASMNRIAWLGQAAACFGRGLPQVYCGGYNLLSKQQQDEANNTALEYLNEWLFLNGHKVVTIDKAITGRQSTIY